MQDIDIAGSVTLGTYSTHTAIAMSDWNMSGTRQSSSYLVLVCPVFAIGSFTGLAWLPVGLIRDKRSLYLALPGSVLSDHNKWFWFCSLAHRVD